MMNSVENLKAVYKQQTPENALASKNTNSMLITRLYSKYVPPKKVSKISEFCVKLCLSIGMKSVTNRQYLLAQNSN